ncbi:MAG TPA: DUF3570 domain-containing protein [Polyangia bacterium]|nr:DUF3570 domain-containing protein [Polyangia bacterium]
MQLRPPSTRRKILSLILAGTAALALVGSPVLARARRTKPAAAKKAVDHGGKRAAPRRTRPVIEKKTDDGGAATRRAPPVVETETESEDERAPEAPRTRPARAEAESEESGESRETAETAESGDTGEGGEDGENGERPRPVAPANKAKRGAIVRASSEVSAYTDTDSVHVLSPTVAGSVGDAIAGWSVSGSYLVDAVSAASVDIVSTASSHWVERRHVGSASANFGAGDAQVTLAGGFSREPDYLSLSGGGMVSLELNDKNFMPFLGGSYGHDLVGRTGDPQSLWPTLDKVSLKTGATFVVDRSTIAALSIDGIFERGYLAKPYRYLPVVAPGVAASIPAGASVAVVRSVNEYSVAENVPTQRDRFAVAGRIAHRSAGATFRGDQRFYRDSWGLLASTTDIHEFIDLGKRVVVWPHLRGHLQRGVTFWRRVVEQVPDPAGGEPGIPRFRAGDRELGPLYTLTGGLGLKVTLNADAAAPWTIALQVDGMYTRYLDAVYITRRMALFSAFNFEAAF